MHGNRIPPVIGESLLSIASEPAAKGELAGLIEQASHIPELRDYRQRPPVDAPIVLPLHPRRVVEAALGLLFVAAVFALSIYGIAVALGKAGS